MLSKPNKIEHYEKRFGIIAIERGYITPDDLIRAMAVQVGEDMKNRQHRLIGTILLDQDLISASQIHEVVESIFREQHRPV